MKELNKILPSYRNAYDMARIHLKNPRVEGNVIVKYIKKNNLSFLANQVVYEVFGKITELSNDIEVYT